MFKQVLEKLSKSMQGVLAVTLIGFDGIPLESLNQGEIALDAVSAEFTAFLKSIQLANTEIDTGDIQQVSVITDRYVIYLSVVTSDYLILLVMSPGANHGKARFELLKAKHALRDELS